MEQLNLNENQSELINLVKLVTEENKIYEIKSNNNSAVLISQKAYENLQETIELLSIPDLRESLGRSLKQINDNETYSLEEVLGDID